MNCSTHKYLCSQCTDYTFISSNKLNCDEGDLKNVMPNVIMGYINRKIEGTIEDEMVGWHC